MQTRAFGEQIFKWECQDNFQKNWNIEELDFGSMYDRSLSHPETGRLWGGSHQSAKSVMMQFIQLNREFVRSMFRDLFSESKDLVMRIERFQFHCDQLLTELKVTHQKINHHFHQDLYMPLLYLTLRYPQTYCIYDRDIFVKSLELIFAKDPQSTTLERFMKVIKIYQSQLLQDEEITSVLGTKIKSTDPELLRSMWLSHEFYRFIAYS